MTKDNCKYIDSNAIIWSFDLKNTFTKHPFAVSMTQSKYPELRLKEKIDFKLKFCLHSSNIMKMKMSFEAGFYSTHMLIISLQLNEMKYQDERTFMDFFRFSINT